MGELKPKEPKRIYSDKDRARQRAYYAKHTAKVQKQQLEYRLRKARADKLVDNVAMKEMDEQSKYFYSLTGKSVAGKRICLKCKKEFLSKRVGNRTCGECAAQNQRQPVRAIDVY